MNKQLNIGWAQVDITPDRPVFVAGQMYPRLSSYIHDPITATCLVLENNEEQYVMVSLDMVNTPKVCCDRFRSRLEAISGLDVSKVAFNGIHSHNSLRGNHDAHLINFPRYLGADRVEPFPMPDDILYGDDEIEFLAERVEAVVRRAWDNRKPGGIATAEDYAAVGFNRRPVFKDEDGSTYSEMYGACSKDNFLRLEGYSDHTINMLYTFDPSGALTGMIVDIPCPAQVYELHRFISADYWCDVRDCIREVYGPVYILSVIGAGGDQNPLDLIRLSRDNEKELELWNEQASEVYRNFDMKEECRSIGERVCDAVKRGYRKAIRNIQYEPEFKHRLLTLKLPIRTVTQADYVQALETIDQLKSQYDADHPMDMHAQVKAYEAIGVALRWERQNQDPDYTFTCHFVRLGRAIFATNPFELFTEYGVRIRARNPFKETFIVQLCDDAGVYLPTHAALAGGSYSSKPATTLLGPDQGDVLVEETLKAIRSLV
ncbi:MAG: hypothetical protein GXY22_02715 [Clostridiaceae bacterium]|jgi:hypothetical protein|nr:hypothetical protein [Clostridiaceae bacterium]